MAKVMVQLSDDEMRQLRRIAKMEVRTVEQQITYFLQQGIDAYLRAYYRRIRDEENDRDGDESSTEQA